MEISFLLKRIALLYDALDKSDCDIFFLTSRLASKYFADFTGSASTLIVSKNSLLFLTDGRYKNELRNINNRFITSVYSENIYAHIKRGKFFDKIKIGVQGDDISFNSIQQLNEYFPLHSFRDVSNLLLPLFSRHDEESLLRIKKAINISKKVFKNVRNNLRENITELDVAAEISYQTKKSGADGDAFLPIVLFGKNSALPHGKPSKRKLKKNDIVLIDIGSTVKGVSCDFTRTFFFGDGDKELKKIISIVQTAKEIGIQKSLNRMKCKDIDSSVRNYITEKGYGDFFVHATGHGVGYDVHLYPRLSSTSQHVLKNNFIITIEPGIYIPGIGGVRLEDDILVNNDKPENLTNF